LTIFNPEMTNTDNKPGRGDLRLGNSRHSISSWSQTCVEPLDVRVSHVCVLAVIIKRDIDLTTANPCLDGESDVAE
jgi:hypothetical protein